MYLEPIFTSEDITKQLPVESKKYKAMERTWRRIMRSAYDVPNVSIKNIINSNELHYINILDNYHMC